MPCAERLISPIAMVNFDRFSARTNPTHLLSGCLDLATQPDLAGPKKSGLSSN